MYEGFSLKSQRPARKPRGNVSVIWTHPETDAEYVVVATVTMPRPARLSGHPDHWEPEECGEVEIHSITDAAGVDRQAELEEYEDEIQEAAMVARADRLEEIADIKAEHLADLRRDDAADW